MTEKINGGEHAGSPDVFPDNCKGAKNIFIRNIGSSQMCVNYLNPFLVVNMGPNPIFL